MTADELMASVREALAEERIQHLVGLSLAMPLTYAVYRKAGAPRWAALVLTDISYRIEMLRFELKHGRD